MSLLKKSALSGSLFIAGSLLGLVNYLLITRRWGIGAESDGFFLSLQLALLLSSFLLGTEFQPAYMGFYLAEKKNGRAGRQLGAALLWLLLLLGPLALLAIWAATAVVHGLAPGLDPVRLELTTALFRLALGAILMQYLGFPLTAACCAEDEAWVEPAALLALTAAVTLSVLHPAGSLQAALYANLGGFLLMILLALWRLARRGVRLEWPERADRQAVGGFILALWPLTGMVLTRSLFRWGLTAVLSSFGAGTVTLVNFGEKLYNSGQTLVTLGFARLALPGVIGAAPQQAAARRRWYLLENAYFSCLLGAGLLAVCTALPRLFFPALPAGQMRLAAAIFGAFALTVATGGMWESVRALGLALRQNRAISLGANAAHLSTLALMGLTWPWVRHLPLSAISIPLYLAFAGALAGIISRRILAARDGAPNSAAIRAAAQTPAPARPLSIAWLSLGATAIGGAALSLFMPALSTRAAAVLVLTAGGLVFAQFALRLRQDHRRTLAGESST